MGEFVSTEESYPWEVKDVLTVVITCCFVQTYLSPLLSKSLFPQRYSSLNAHIKARWDTRVAGFIWSICIGILSICTFLSNDEPADKITAVDRIWSYNKNNSRISAACLGYGLWELIIAVRDIKTSRVSTLLHCVASLCTLMTEQASQPFLNNYSIWFHFYHLSSPFLHIHWFCDVLGLAGSPIQLSNGVLLLAVFFWVRLVCGNYQLLATSGDLLSLWGLQSSSSVFQYQAATDGPQNWSHSSDAIVGEPAERTEYVPLWRATYIMSSLTVLAGLNLFWFYKLYGTVKQRFALRRTQTKNVAHGGLSEMQNGQTTVSSLPARQVPPLKSNLWLIGAVEMRYAAIGSLTMILARLQEVVLMIAPDLRRVLKKIVAPSPAEKQAPSTQMEIKMQKLWADVLGVAAGVIGANDNFFQLGGSSVQAILLVAKAREHGLEFTVADLFTSLTLSDLAYLTKSIEKHQIVDPLPFELLPEKESVDAVIDEVASLCKLDRDCVEDISVCTPLQEGMMTLSQTGDAYVERYVIALEPAVRDERIVSAWDDLVRTTAILRTRIVQSHICGRLHQVVTKEQPHWFSYDSSLEAYLEKDRQFSMGFGDPLIRCAIAKGAETSQRYLVWTVHHALYDGWSLSLIAQSLACTYNDLPPLQPPVKFNRFVRYVMDANSGNSAKDFWRSQLSGSQPSTFPAVPDRKYQPKADSTYSYKIQTLDREMRRHITTPTIIRAAWGLLMNQHERSESVVFGVIVSGRNGALPGIEGVVGPTIATVPVRADSNPDRKVGDYLQDIQDQSTAMIPFEQYGIQNITAIDSETQSACQFQNLLIIQPNVWVSDIPGIGTVRQDSSRPANDKTYPLVIECTIGEDRIEILASFDSTLVSEYRIARVVAQLEHILQQMRSADDTLRIGDIETLSPCDKYDITQWNGSIPERVQRCVHDLVAEQAFINPEKIAVCGWDTTFTYSKLEDLSSRVARNLIDAGIGPDELVPLLFEKSAWTVVAMLGVLKAGGACAPLDPKQPIFRLQTMIKDLRPQLVLSSEACTPLSEEFGWKVISIGPRILAAGEGSNAPTEIPSRAKPHHAAFVVFTSGSTGTPKAIILEHVAFCSSARAHGSAMRLGPESRVLQFASYSFDVSLGEIFSTLLHGGCVCVLSEEERMNALADAINRMDVNWAYLTPSVASLLDPQDVPNLKILSVGGEAVTQGVVTKWANSVFLTNVYGPAETTIWSTCLSGLKPDTPPSIIGCGVGSLSWVVDPANHDKLVPVGCIGELLLEGPILARGYLEKEQTKAAFIRDPIWARENGSCAGRRFYKSGDLVRYREDGALEFIGRKVNAQVKLRGQRIELGEIEHHLSINKAVRHAVVIVPGSGPYNQQLVVVYSLQALNHHTEKGGESDDLRLIPNSQHSTLFTSYPKVQEYLSERVPQYMVPTVWIAVQNIPLLCSGKLNRKRVTEWLHTVDERTVKAISALFAEEADGEIQLPTTETEKMVLEIWSSALDEPADQISLHRAFLGLGGNSITAMKVVSLLRRKGCIVSFADVFHSRSVVQLASLVKRATENSAELIKEPLSTSLPLLPVMDRDLETLVKDRSPQIGDQGLPEVEDVYPCSPMQRDLLLGQAKAADNYNSYISWEIAASSGSDRVDLQRVEEAWQVVVNRHPSLRTFIINAISEDGVYDQVVLKHVNAKIRILDAGELDDFSSLRERPPVCLDTSGLLHHLTLCEAPTGSVFCKLEINHAIVDGTSLQIIKRDFLDSYHRTLPKEPGPKYSDFISYLRHEPSGLGLKYWKDYLSGVEPCYFPALNDGLNCPPTCKTRDFSPKNFAQIDHVCKEKAVTLSNIVQTAWALVLRSYTNAESVCFGYAASCRDNGVVGIEDAVGLFIATLVCRLDFTESMTTYEAMRKVQRDFSNGVRHKYCPLTEIQHALDLKHQGLFNTVVSIETYPSEKIEGTEEVVFKNMAGHVSTEFDLSVNVRQVGQDVTVSITYRTSQISEAYVTHVSTAFLKAIECIVQMPDVKVDEVDLLNDSHRRQLSAWNCENTEAIERCLHDIIAYHADANGDAPAINSCDGDFTYAELDTMSSRLAAHLVSLGVGPEVPVPFCFEKSAWVPVAMLAVLKAGGAFVPLDPSHPTERRRGVIQGLKATIILASPRQVTSIKDLVDVVISVSADDILKLEPGSIVLPTVSPKTLAYILFTSGTTGKPRGVMMSHEAFCTSILNHGRALGLATTSRVLQFSSYVFDASLTELFATLAHGGCVCIPTEEERLSNIEGVINKMHINFALLTPPIARLIEPDNVPSLKAICVGGESVGPDIISTWRDTSTTLIIAYGPTETAIMSHAGTAPSLKFRANTIGSPIGCTSWITEIDNPHRLMPIGCVGELLIGGPILARMYLNHQETTDAAFIPDPQWAKNFEQGPHRVYRTGDLVRYNSDGTMHFLGRKDTQVKLHGQRFELAEVEHNLRRLVPTEYNVAAEILQPHHYEGESILAGFIAKSNQLYPQALALSPSLVDAVSEGHLRFDEMLPKWLPAYMVPSVYIPLEYMPLTVSGKIDHQRIKRFAGTLTAEELLSFSVKRRNGRLPSTSSERLLQGLWAEFLHLDHDRVFADSNFFELGGDSMIAIRLVATAQKRQIQLRVSDIFQNPVLSNLSELVGTEEMTVAAEVEPFSLLPTEARDCIREQASLLCGVDAVEDVYPCSSLQEGLMALSIKQPGAYLLQVPFRLPKNLDLARFKAAWEATIRSIPILRTRIFHSTDHGLFQGVVVNERTSWESSADLLAYSEHKPIAQMGLGQSLSRYAIVNQEDGMIFVWTLHHAIYDAFTLPLILETVETFYRGDLPAPLLPFNRFIKSINDIDVQASQEFWRSELSGVNYIHFPKLPSPQYRATVDRKLERLAKVPWRKSSITRATLIQAAWALVLTQYTGFSEVVYGAIVNGRNAPIPGMERLVGPTINIVPFRVRLDISQTIIDFLQHLQEQTARSMEHEQLGLQNIQSLSPEIREACGFHNILAIQPESVTSRNGNLFNDPVLSNEASGFFEHPLTVECVITDDGVNMRVHYDSHLTSPLQMTRILRQFEHVLNEFVLTDDQSTIQCTISSNPDDDQEILAWNEACPDILDDYVHGLIEKQVLARPEAQAICAWDIRLTYAELEAASSSLAQRLIALGVGPEVFVPLCFDKSGWTTVAMLAVLKAGGACVAIDPKYPMSRSRDIIQRCQANIVVTAPQHAHLFSGLIEQIVPVEPSLLQTTRTQIPDSLLVVSQSSNGNLRPENTAFIVFTSGSTGAPKGIILEHRSVCSSARSHAAAYGIGPHSRVFQFSAYTFDASYAEQFTTLIFGGCVCIPSEVDRLNNLPKVMDEFDVNWSFFTPRVADLFSPSDVPKLKTLAVGGEPMTHSIISKWHNKLRLMNTYGPSECTIWSAYADIDHGSDPTNIGRPVGGSLWIVDPTNQNKLMPIGCVGELLVGGPIVARGYLRDEEKTKAAFIVNPEWATKIGYSSQHPKFYKTGDLVQYNSDGTISFVGRKDTQVKLRGQRLELGEVDYHLQRLLPDDWQVVTEMIRPSYRESDAMLASFVCAAKRKHSDQFPADVALDPDAMRDIELLVPRLESGLAEHLPTYMIPSAYIPLNRVPITANCKADRRLLRELGSQLSAQELARYCMGGRSKRPPSTPVEMKLQRLWTEVLHQDASSIGADDNFFQLGGDSIKAIRLVTMARDVGLQMTVAMIFQAPTLAKLSATCTIVDSGQEIVERVQPYALLANPTTVPEIRLKVASLCNVDVEHVEDVYPSTPLQEGLMALSLKQPGTYIMRSCYKLPADVDVQRFQRACEAANKDLPILRTRLVEVNGKGLLQVVLKSKVVWSSAGKLETYLTEDRKSPMGLCDSLSRYAVVEAGDGGKLFVWTVHHAIYDAWTLSLVLKVVGDYYYQGTRHTHLVPYVNFIASLEAQDRNDIKRFWQSQAAMAESTYVQFPALPSPQYRVFVDSQVSHRADIAWKPGSTVTHSTVIRAAWALVLSGYSGSPDVLFGVTLSGRNASVPGIEAIAGPAINTLPVFIRCSPQSSTLAFLEALQKQSSNMTPFEQTRLSQIRHFEPKLCDACNFQNILVVQTPLQIGSSTALFNNPISISSQNAGFFAHPLTVECTVAETGVDITAYFDSNVISCQQMERVLKFFEHMIKQLTDGCHPLIGDLDQISPQDLHEIEEWNSDCPLSVHESSLTTISDQARVRPDTETIRVGCATECTLWRVDRYNHNHLITIGCAGELLLEGPNLGLGYVNNVGQTKKSFIENPGWAARIKGSEQSQPRKLKTGDLARHRADGTISFVSRKGTQVEHATGPLELEDIERSKCMPATEMEIKLQQLWANVLHLDANSISANDAFIRLGGDSIIAMRLVAATREAGVFLTVSDILQNPSLSEMALVACANARGRSPPIQTDMRNVSLDLRPMTASLENAISSQAGIAKEEVEDVFEATEFQIWAITAGMMKHRGHTNYFTFNFDSSLDRVALESSCRAVVMHHPILRTTFIVHDHKVLQVVPRRLSVQFHTYHCDGNLTDYIQTLVAKDKLEDVKLGQQMLRWIYIDSRSGGSCLILRMSHAQYDGICLPLIYNDLKATYVGEALLECPSFSRFIALRRAADTPLAGAFWAESLKGSSMTQFLSQPQQIFGDLQIRTISQRIPAVSLTESGLTFATILKTAWAFVLSRLSRKKDVVFGQLLSGRNLPLLNIDKVVGCCLNVTPVRVKMDSDTVSGLLKRVQDDYVASVPYESLSFQKIVERCTDWPRSTRFSSVVQHQNLDETVDSASFGDINCKFGAISSPTYASDVFVFSQPKGSEIGISITWNQEAISRGFAKDVLEKLCMTVVAIGTDPYQSISSLSESIEFNSYIPLAVEREDLAVTSLRVVEHVGDCSSSLTIVDEAWDALVQRESASKDEDVHEVSFFEVWEEAIIAARFVQFYKERGISVTMEEVLAAPTRKLQGLLISRKLSKLCIKCIN